MESQEEFKFLLDALKGLQTNLLDSGHKVLGYMVIALSWLVTSDATRNFLAGRSDVRACFVAFLGLSIVGYSVMVWRVLAISRSIFRNLVRLDYAKSEVYEHYAIKEIVPIYYDL